MLAVLLIVAFFVLFPGEPRREPPQAPAVRAFEEIAVPFEHGGDSDASFGFLGAAAIDVDADGRMEVFLGGGQGQDDVLLSYRDGALVDRIEGTGLSGKAATYGATAVDMDADGDTDMIIGRVDGVTLYLNDGGRFTAQPIATGLPEQTDPFAVSVADYDGDGDGDLYISGFVSAPAFVGLTFNDPSVVRPNRLLRNDGLTGGVMGFTDVTAQAGVEGLYNTFQSVWVDLDRDDDPDLVTAPNTGRVEIFRNDGGRFTELPSPSDYGFWMCAAVGDIDNDGDQDLFFSNAGNVLPSRLLTGDLRDDQAFSPEWLLLRNDGELRFSDVTVEYGLDGYGFAWGASFADLDYDGFLDLVVAKNSEKIFTHAIEALRPSSNAFLQLPDGEGGRSFYDIEALRLQHPDLGMAPLYVDLDGDGSQDVVMPNQNQRARAHLNRHEGRRLRVVVPDVVRALGARITVVTEAGRTTTHEFGSSVGFMSDHSPVLVFGLGSAETIEQVEVHWAGGPTVTVAGDTVVDDRVVLTLP